MQGCHLFGHLAFICIIEAFLGNIKRLLDLGRAAEVGQSSWLVLFINRSSTRLGLLVLPLLRLAGCQLLHGASVLAHLHVDLEATLEEGTSAVRTALHHLSALSQPDALHWLLWLTAILLFFAPHGV